MHYDPTDFDDDIRIILKRGLGRGMGFDVVDEYSLLDGSDPELLDLISDRVCIIYNMLYEDVEPDEAEDDDEEQAQPMTPLDREIQIAEEEENEDEYEKEDEDISDLDEEIIE